MKDSNVVVLLLAGIGITAVVAFLILRPAGYNYSYRAVPQPQKVPQKYNNEETWNFLKDKNGRVTGVEIHRNAEQN